MSLWQAFKLALKHTFEGNDGKISSRKTTAFWFTILITLTHAILFYVAAFKDQAKLLIDTLVVDILALFILFGLTTVSAILSFWRKAPDEKKEENTEV